MTVGRGKSGDRVDRADRETQDFSFVRCLLHTFSSQYKTLVLFNINTHHHNSKVTAENTEKHNMTTLNKKTVSD